MHDADRSREHRLQVGLLNRGDREDVSCSPRLSLGRVTGQMESVKGRAVSGCSVGVRLYVVTFIGNGRLGLMLNRHCLA